MVSSVQGSGSVFTITIPGIEVRNSRTDQGIMPVIDPSQISFLPASILIVDDSQGRLQSGMPSRGRGLPYWRSEDGITTLWDAPHLKTEPRNNRYKNAWFVRL